MGADQGGVTVPKPKKPDPIGIGCYVLQVADQLGEAINPDRDPYLDERAPVDPLRGIMQTCTALDRLTEHALRGLQGLGQHLVDWWRNRPQGIPDYRCTPYFRAMGHCPDDHWPPPAPVPTPSPTPPSLVDDTGHAREQARDPQCLQDGQPTVGRCTADGTYVPPTPTTATRVPPPYETPTPEPTPTPTPTRTPTPTPPPAPAPTPTPPPRPTPPPYVPPPYVPPPYVPPPTPTPPPPTPTPTPAPTAHPDPPKPRPRLLNNRCVGVSMRAAVRGEDPGLAYLACMAEGGWTP